MDDPKLLGDLALHAEMTPDGGPRARRRAGVALPEKYLPGRFLAGLHPEVRAEVIRATNSRTMPATWYLRLLVGLDEPRRVPTPPEPIDRRWSRHGRWST